MLARKEKEEAREKAIRTQREQETERKRLDEERLQRAQERIQKERDAIQREEAKRLAESIKKKAGIDVSNEDLENLDTDRLMEMQVEELEKERQRAQARLKTIARKVDHTERAYRKEEIPLLEKDYAHQKEQDKVNQEIEKKERQRIHRENYEHGIYHKNRMQRMLTDFHSAKKGIEEKNSERLAKLRAELHTKLEEAKKARIKEYHRLKKEEEEHKARETELERKRAEEQEEAERRAREKREAEAKKPTKYVPPGRRSEAPAASSTSSQQPSGGGDSWRSAGVYTPPSRPSPAPAQSNAPAKPGVWKPRRLRDDAA